MTGITEFLCNEIYPKINIPEALSELNPVETGGKWKIDCPKCHAKGEAFTYPFNGQNITLTCNSKNSCGYKQSLWDYKMEYCGLSNQDTYQELASHAGVELPSNNGHDWTAWKEDKSKAAVLESAHKFFQQQLWKPEGNEYREYLNGRGYSDTEIKGMKLGCYSSREDLLEHLKLKTLPQELSNKSFGITHKLSIPFRDLQGVVTGFSVRTIGDHNPKYINSTGIKLDTPNGLHIAKELNSITVVEGQFDALIAAQRGISGVVATGGGTISPQQLATVVSTGVKQITLALDNDKAGCDGTEKALDRILETGLRAYVVTMPEGIKDPDELIREQGVEAFQKLIDEAAPGPVWKANRLISQHSIDTPKQMDALIDEALKWSDRFPDERSMEKLLEIIADRTGHTVESLLAERKLTRKDDCLDSLNGQKFASIQDSWLEPYSLDKLVTEIRETSQGINSGYEELDILAPIPNEALTILAARPGEGKTTLALNMMLNMAEANPDQNFIFISYEETRKQVALKLLNMIVETVLDGAQNLLKLGGYLKTGENGNAGIEEGKSRLDKLLAARRIIIIETTSNVDQLTGNLKIMAEQLNVGAVCIDYIQKVKLNGKFNTRQMELQKVSEKLLETTKSLSIPIILGCQLGRGTDGNRMRLDNLRECGDIEQDANLVIGLQKVEDKLTVHILKNRYGPNDEVFSLKFNSSTLRISDDIH